MKDFSHKKCYPNNRSKKNPAGANNDSKPGKYFTNFCSTCFLNILKGKNTRHKRRYYREITEWQNYPIIDPNDELYGPGRVIYYKREDNK